MQTSIDRDQFRSKLLKYTRIAFHMLPKLENPSILDVGCGSGVPTLELCRLSDGHITAIDNNQDLISRLRKKCIQVGFRDRISPIVMSIRDMDFGGKVFDIIWAEGSVFVLGFENSIRDWREHIKDSGFLVIHDQMDNLDRKLKLILKYDYTLLSSFEISSDIWWKEYYEPLQKFIEERESELDMQITRPIKREIDEFKRQNTSSIYLVMQKT